MRESAKRDSMWRGCWSGPLGTPQTKGRDPQDRSVIQRILLGVLILALPGTLGQAAAGPQQQISLNQYTQELDRLHTVAEACAQELSSNNPAAGSVTPPWLAQTWWYRLPRQTNRELRVAAGYPSARCFGRNLEEPTKRRERSLGRAQ